MLLESQKQFMEDYLRPQVTQSVSHMPPGYSELYGEWEMAYAEALEKWGPEERTKSFAEYLDARIQEKIEKIIPNENLVDEKNHKLAKRGQVALASKDGGKTFDTVLKPEDIPNVDPKDYLFLSTDMRSATNDLRQILDEQFLFRIAVNLGRGNYNVENAYLQNGIAVLEVLNPKLVSYTIQVDPKQKFNKPLNYIYINRQGLASVVPETQLPEAFGNLRPEASLKPLNREDLHRQIFDSADRKNQIAMLGAAAALPFLNKSASPSLPETSESKEENRRSVNIPKTSLPTSSNYGDVQQAKQRLELAKKQAENSQEKESERRAKYEEDSRKKRQADQIIQASQVQEQKKTSNKKSLIRSVLAGGGIGAGIIAGVGGGTGITVFINTILR